MPRKILFLLLVTQITLLPCLFSQTNEQLRANLYSFNTDSTLSLTDGNLTMYAFNNSNAIDGMDALKMTNFGENFGLSRGTRTLAIERRQSITTADTIFFKMWNMREKNYKLTLYLAGLTQPGLSGILEDQYLNTATELNLNGANNSVFTVTNDPASSATGRFRIIFSFPVSTFQVLPVTFTGIKSYQDNNNINLEWSVENEKDIAEYQVQKSINGQQFFTVTTIDVKGKSRAHYKWTDSLCVKGNNFYRINSRDINGKTEYSNVTKIFAGIDNNSISVYPNPVVNGILNIQMAGQPKGPYKARLITITGKMVYSTQIQNNTGNSAQTIRLNKNNGKGDFILEIIYPDKSKVSRKILVQ